MATETSQPTMHTLAVSHSIPQWVDIEDKRVQTSIIHTPLTNPDDSILVQDCGGIKGNKPAVHNGEVYAFFAHHYDYWRKRLGVEETWEWCHWGENITFRCEQEMSEADFHLGDVWNVGGNVLLQVCGSRVPCFKLAWRCGQKASFLQELASTGKCGVYFKVFQGGRVHPGDVAHLVERSQRNLIDCATITRVAFADALTTKDTMNILVDHPDLLEMNKIVFRRKLSILHDKSLVGNGRWKGWRRVRVYQTVVESPDVKSFYMKAINSTKKQGPLAAHLPGQFVSVRLPNGLTRTWSLSTYPDEKHREAPEFYRVSIKKAGLASNWMHAECVPGTILEIQSPRGSFCLDWSPQFPGRQVYMSAGIGITPMMCMLRAHLQHQAMQRAPVVWVHVSRTFHTMLFRGELETLMHTKAAQELGVQVLLFFTAMSQTECHRISTKLDLASATLTIHSGRPEMHHLQSVFEDPYTMDPLRITPFEIEGRFSTIYICGTGQFEKKMRDIAKELRVPDPMVISESFSGHTAVEAPEINEAEVVFTKSNLKASWRKGASKRPENRDGVTSQESNSTANGPSLLELAESLGLAPDFGCRTGVCGACEQTLCKGKVTGGLQPGGSVRICIARPASEMVDIDM